MKRPLQDLSMGFFDLAGFLLVRGMADKGMAWYATAAGSFVGTKALRLILLTW